MFLSHAESAETQRCQDKDAVSALRIARYVRESAEKRWLRNTAWKLCVLAQEKSQTFSEVLLIRSKLVAEKKLSISANSAWDINNKDLRIKHEKDRFWARLNWNQSTLKPKFEHAQNFNRARSKSQQSVLKIQTEHAQISNRACSKFHQSTLEISLVHARMAARVNTKEGCAVYVFQTEKKFFSWKLQVFLLSNWFYVV